MESKVKICRNPRKSDFLQFAMKRLSPPFQASWPLHSTQAPSLVTHKYRTSLDRTRTMPNRVERIGDGHDGFYANLLRRSPLPPISYFWWCRWPKIAFTPPYLSPPLPTSSRT